ncbi:MAG: hypothetical protein WC517_01135 [Patescibacteria group bacterium]
MKNFIYIIVIIACLGLIVFGLVKKEKPAGDLTVPAAVSTNAIPGAVQKTTATSAPTAIGQNVQHFRPDTITSSGDEPADAAQAAERNFQITPELLAKMHLIDKYNPGICYGAPVAVPQSAIDMLVSSNPPLVAFLKQKYDLTSDLEVYNKMKQLQAVSLVETASSKFNFTFMDGQCRNVVYYEGTVQVAGSTVTATVANQTSHTY